MKGKIFTWNNKVHTHIYIHKHKTKTFFLLLIPNFFLIQSSSIMCIFFLISQQTWVFVVIFLIMSFVWYSIHVEFPLISPFFISINDSRLFIYTVTLGACIPHFEREWARRVFNVRSTWPFACLVSERLCVRGLDTRGEFLMKYFAFEMHI